MAITHKILLAVVAAAVAAAVIYVALPRTHTMAGRQITIDSHAVFVDVADTEVLREQGLSGRPPLLDGEGMLFIFDHDDAWGIWMKDMRFPIDILWADAEGKVVTVVAAADPASYPQIFYPTLPARYVVELPAGYAGRNGISQGSKIVVQ